MPISSIKSKSYLVKISLTYILDDMHGANTQTVQDIIGIIVIVGGTLLYWKSRVPAQTIKNLQASNDSYVELDRAREASVAALKKQIEDNEDKHREEVKAFVRQIGELTGQIQVYKELPLRELADGIKQVVELTKDNATSNQQILETLRESATTLSSEKRDGGLLVKTKDGTPLEVKI